MNLNKAFVCGRLTKDPELRSTTGGQSVASFSIATNRVWTDKAGAKQEEVQFHNIVAWGRTAEIVHQFAKKGSELLVEGHLQTRSWEDKTGGKRQTTEIVAEHVQLGARPANSSTGQADGRPPLGKRSAPQDELPTINVDDQEELKVEDLPF